MSTEKNKQRNVISIAEISRKYGISKPTISKWMDQGKLPHRMNSKNNREMLREEVIPLMDQYSLEQNEKKFGGRAATAEQYNAAKALRESYNARIQKLTYETKIKKLISVEVVEKRLFELALQIRDSILNIPNKVSPELASMKNEKKINAFLDATLREALEAISEGEFEKFRKGKLRGSD